MSWNKLAALAASLAAIATACGNIMSNYDVEFHLEPDRPNISRTWDADEDIPDEIAEKF